MTRLKKYLNALICLPYGTSGPQNCTLKALVYTVIGYIEQIIVVIFALSTLTFIWGVFQYTVAAQGDEKKTAEAKNVIFYGTIGLFVMVSVWGILKVIQKTFFG
jgi:hypothetical protein